MAKRGVVGNRLDFIEPMQPTLVDEPPQGEDWVHELKLDGYRSQVVLEAGKARVFTWRGHDWTDKYWPIARAAEALACRSAIIDGEMIVLDEIGRVFFRELRSAIMRAPTRLAFVAFDLLHLNGEDLRDRPLFERRQMLWELIQPAAGADPVLGRAARRRQRRLRRRRSYGPRGHDLEPAHQPLLLRSDHAVAQDQVL